MLVTNPLTFLTHFMPHYFPPHKPEVENIIPENDRVENSMDRGAWWGIAHRVTRVRHDLATKPPPPYIF